MQAKNSGARQGLRRQLQAAWGRGPLGWSQSGSENLVAAWARWLRAHALAEPLAGATLLMGAEAAAGRQAPGASTAT